MMNQTKIATPLVYFYNGIRFDFHKSEFPTETEYCFIVRGKKFYVDEADLPYVSLPFEVKQRADAAYNKYKPALSNCVEFPGIKVGMNYTFIPNGRIGRQTKDHPRGEKCVRLKSNWPQRKIRSFEDTAAFYRACEAAQQSYELFLEGDSDYEDEDVFPTEHDIACEEVSKFYLKSGNLHFRYPNYPCVNVILCIDKTPNAIDNPLDLLTILRTRIALLKSTFTTSTWTDIDYDVLPLNVTPALWLLVATAAVSRKDAYHQAISDCIKHYLKYTMLEDWRSVLNSPEYCAQLCRSPFLLKQLETRGLLTGCNLRTADDGTVYPIEEPDYYEIAVQEMEDPGQSGSQANSTSIEQNTDEVSESNPEEVITEAILKEVSTEATFAPTQMADRWIRLAQIRWDANGLGPDHKPFVTYDLPVDLGKTVATACESLVTSMWQLNRLQRLGFEIRFVAPAQAFITGALLAKFYYDAYADRDIEYRYNKFSMSQGKNVEIRPGAKTAASLNISWNNKNSALSNQVTLYDTQGTLNMGRLVICELNSLRCGPGVTPIVDVAVEIRFEGMHLHGRIPSNILKTPLVRQEGLISETVNSDAMAPVMGIVDDVEKMLNSVRPSQNEDKPPDPQNKTVVIPRFAESFSGGTGVSETLQPLRLDLCGKKPGILKTKMNHIKHISRTWGLYRQIVWTTSQDYGTVLTSFPIEAVNTPSEYASVAVGDNIGRGMPPVDILASNFVFWVGNFEYRIEVINTTFHNGALMAVMVPLVDTDDIVPLSIFQLNNVKRDVSAIGQGLSEMVVTTDFHNLNHLFATRSSDRYAVAPRRSMGQFQLLVSNILQANEGVSQTVEINIFKRGAPDFEVLELKGAILSPAYNAPIVAREVDTWTPAANTDWYCGHFARAQTIPGVLTVGNGILPSGTEWWFNPSPGEAGGGAIAQIVRNPAAAGETQRWIHLAGTITAISVSEIEYRFRRLIQLPWFDDSGSRIGGDGAFVAFPFVEEMVVAGSILPVTPAYFEAFRHAVIAYLANFSEGAETILNGYLMTGTNQTDYFGVYFTEPNNGTRMQNLGLYFIKEPTLAVQEMENATLTTSAPTSRHAGTKSGMSVFGEEGGEIMSIMRRPIYRSQFSYNPHNNSKWPYVRLTIDTPHFFNPIDLAEQVDYSNRYTPQGILQTGFTWVSGSLNRRIFGPSIAGTNMWVNHKVYDKPNYDLFMHLHDSPDTLTPVYIQSLANEFINLSLNSHVNVCIPWKQENLRNLLMRRPPGLTDGSTIQCYDIGRMNVGFQEQSNATAPNVEYIYTIYDSWGDDCEISGFRGFPLMVFDEEITDDVPDPVLLQSIFQEKEPARQEGLVDGVKSYFKVDETVDIAIEKAASAIATAVRTEATDATTIATAEINKLMEKLKTDHAKLSMDKLGIVLAGEALHLMANPSLKTIIVSFINIILQLGLFTLNLGQSLITELGRLITPNKPEEGSDQFTQEGSVEEGDSLGSILSLLAAGICSYIGWTSPITKHIDWKTKLAMAIPSFVGGAWSFKRFMNGFFPMFKWMWESIMHLKIYMCDEVEAGFITSSEDMLTQWVKEVNTLDMNNRTHSGVEDRDRIVVAAAIADVIETKILIKSNKYSWFRPYVEKIKALHANVIKEGSAPYVRKEPFCTWWYGSAGVGKSYVTDGIMTDIIKHAGIHVSGEKTLLVSPTSKFLTRVTNQPEVKIDDFLAVNNPEATATQLSYLFEICTPAPYCPNQAHVDNKNNLFAPSFLTICSNMAYPPNMPISTPQAFLRRVNVRVEVKGNPVFLSEKYGAEFNSLLTKDGFTYGHLPQRMKENNQHLTFTYVYVDPNGKTFPIRINGKVEQTYDEMMVILKKKYDEHKDRANASYANRIRNHYEVRNMEVPPALEILDDMSTPALSIIMAKWLAVHNADVNHNMRIERIAKALDDDRHLGGNYKAILEKYYPSDKSKQESDADEGIASEAGTSQFNAENNSAPDFMCENAMYSKEIAGKFPSPLRPKILAVLSNLPGVDHYAETCLDVDAEVVDVYYELMKSATCKHKMNGVIGIDYRTALREEECDTMCWYSSDVKLHVLGHISLYSSIKERKLITRAMHAIPRCLADCFRYAKDTVSKTLKRVFAGIKFMGVSIYEFVTEHWKALAIAVTGFITLYYTFVKDSDGQGYLAKIMPDGKIVTKLGVPVTALMGGVHKVKEYFTGVPQEMPYNSKIRVVPVSVNQGKLVAQEMGNEQNIDDIVRITRDAYLMLLCEMDDDWFEHKHSRLFTMHAFCYGGRKSVMIRHEFEVMARHAVRIKAVMHNKNGTIFTVEIDKSELVFQPFAHYGPDNQFMRSGNFGIVDLPVQIPQRRSLIKYDAGKVKYSLFQGPDTLNTMEGVFITPTTLDDKGIYVEKIYSDYGYSTVMRDTTPTVHSVTKQRMTSPTVYGSNYVYNFSKHGYCLGALIDRGSMKIVGFHYCGNGAKGWSEKISHSMLPADDYEYTVPVLTEPNETFDAINGAIYPIGHTKDRHQQSGKTAIRKSFIHGAVEVTTAPAILSPDDNRVHEFDLGAKYSPLYEGVSKHGLPPRPFPSEWVGIAKRDFVQKLKTLKPVLTDAFGCPRRVSTHEAIFGLPGYYNSMDFSTSLGYGWGGFTNGKRQVVDPETGFIHPILLQRVEGMTKSFMEGKIPFVVAVDCLKDETLKFSKIRKPGSTRIISTMPFEYQILLRVAALPFMAAHQKHNLDFEHAIGISVIGPNECEFDRLGKMLEGGKILAGDFKNFGPGASCQVAKAALEVVVEWYRHYNAPKAFITFVEAVFSVLLNTNHLCYDKLYATPCGIVSGSGVTVVLNSLIHSLYMRIAACGLGVTMPEFNSSLQLWTYGDDGIAKVHNNICERYNMITLAAFFERYGITYTSVSKDAIEQEWCELKDTSFLKHSFILHDDTYMAGLDKTSIENQINWISKNGDPFENTLCNVKTALGQAYAHGQEYYDNLRMVATEAFTMKGRFVSLPRYEDMRIERYQGRTNLFLPVELGELLMAGNYGMSSSNGEPPTMKQQLEQLMCRDDSSEEAHSYNELYDDSGIY
jgi:hypothetical protein